MDLEIGAHGVTRPTRLRFRGSKREFEIDGLESMRRLRKSEATKAIPVIVVTANVNEYEASQRESKAIGAAAFLTKPLSPARLVQEIQRLLPPQPSA